MFSLIIPIYKNESNLERLLAELVKSSTRLHDELEVVFVVDGSPDHCYEILRSRLPQLPLRSQILLLSRNFGSFSAVMAGLEAGQGKYFAVLAADLQEPPELADQFFHLLESNKADIVFGTRESRSDSVPSDLASSLFWHLFRRFVVKDMPPGGVDVFGCNHIVRDRLMTLRESTTNLIALLLWLGYRREYVSYRRLNRQEGKSAWTLRKKIRYSLNSVFNFTDLPIQLLMYLGFAVLCISCFGSVLLIIARLTGSIQVPGYTPILLAILFFGAISALGLGIVGQYVWLVLQNTRGRPNYIVHHREHYNRLSKFSSLGS